MGTSYQQLEIHHFQQRPKIRENPYNRLNLILIMLYHPRKSYKYSVDIMKIMLNNKAGALTHAHGSVAAHGQMENCVSVNSCWFTSRLRSSVQAIVLLGSRGAGMIAVSFGLYL